MKQWTASLISDLPKTFMLEDAVKIGIEEYNSKRSTIFSYITQNPMILVDESEENGKTCYDKHYIKSWAQALREDDGYLTGEDAIKICKFYEENISTCIEYQYAMWGIENLLRGVGVSRPYTSSELVWSMEQYGKGLEGTNTSRMTPEEFFGVWPQWTNKGAYVPPYLVYMAGYEKEEEPQQEEIDLMLEAELPPIVYVDGKTLYQKKCLMCGDIFRTKHPNQMTCGQSCGNKLGAKTKADNKMEKLAREQRTVIGNYHPLNLPLVDGVFMKAHKHPHGEVLGKMEEELQKNAGADDDAKIELLENIELYQYIYCSLFGRAKVVYKAYDLIVVASGRDVCIMNDNGYMQLNGRDVRVGFTNREDYLKYMDARELDG